ncbi:MAG: hypothetical protein JNJ45_10965 [Chthonomonas sp.]|nr:hypothetical protein [Chthonomonas sp.]
MVYFVPGIIAIAVLLLVTRLQRYEKAAASDFVGAGLAAALGLAAYLLARSPMASGWEGQASLYGMAIGAFLGAIMHLLPDYKEFRGSAGFAVALMGIAAIQTPSMIDSRGMILGLLGGVGVVWLISASDRLAGLVLGATVLGSTHLFAKEIALEGTAEPIRLSVAMAMVWLLVSVGEAFAKGENRRLVRIAGGVGATMLVVFMGRNLLGVGQMWQPGLLGLGAAALVAWFVPKDEAKSGPYATAAALLWLGLCTVAVGFDRALGLPIMLFSAATMMVCLDRPGLLITLAPVVAMLLFRVMRLADPAAMRSIDLGQNYAVVGLLAGFLMVQLSGIWGATNRIARGLAGVTLALLVAACLVLMGGRGSLGLILGAALATAFVLREAEGGLRALASGLAVAGIGAGLHLGMLPFAAFDKEAKLQILIKIFVAAAIFAIASVAAARSKQEESLTHETA